MKVGVTKGHNPAQVRLHHRVLAIQYPDACLPLGLRVDILRMSHERRDCPPEHVLFSIRGLEVLDRLQREAPRSVGLWQRALYDFRLQ